MKMKAAAAQTMLDALDVLNRIQAAFLSGNITPEEYFTLVSVEAGKAAVLLHINN